MLTEEQVKMLNGLDVTELQDYIKARLSSIKPGAVVHIANLSSWEGWTAKLVSVDTKTSKCIVEIERKELGKSRHSTDLANLRIGPWPTKKQGR